MNTIKSRYSLTTISSDKYETINISGSTSGSTSGVSTLIGNKTKSLSQGYVFAPYIILQSGSSQISNEWYREWQRHERKEKLKKIYGK